MEFHGSQKRSDFKSELNVRQVWGRCEQKAIERDMRATIGPLLAIVFDPVYQHHLRSFKTCRYPPPTPRPTVLKRLVWGGAWALVLFFSCPGDLNVQVLLRNIALNKVISAVEASFQRIKKEGFFFFFSRGTCSLNIRHRCLASVSCLAV